MRLEDIKGKCTKGIDAINKVAGISPQKCRFIIVDIDNNYMSNIYMRYPDFSRKWMAVFLRKRNLDSVVGMIKRNEHRISWVDILLYSSNGSEAIYFVEMIYLNKEDEEVNFHACVQVDLKGNAILHSSGNDTN